MMLSISASTGGSSPVSGTALAMFTREVAHALDVVVGREQRRDQAQVAGDRRLQRDQVQQALVDVEVAAVDLVVGLDHHAGELDVLVEHRLDSAVGHARRPGRTSRA